MAMTDHEQDQDNSHSYDTEATAELDNQASVEETSVMEEHSSVTDESPATEMDKTLATETVVIKKGGFLLFLTFLLALAALGLSAYQYYLQHWAKQAPQEQSWQQPLNDMEAQLKRQMSTISQQMDALKSSNQALASTLQSVQQAQQTAQQNGQESPQAITTSAYDDAEIKQQIAALTQQIKTNQQNTPAQLAYDDTMVQQKLDALEMRLAEQEQQMSALQTIIKTTELEQQQALQNVLRSIDQKASEPQVVATDNSQYQRQLLKSTLQAARIQLNINANRQQASTLLVEAQQQATDSGVDTLVSFANRIGAFVDELSKVPVIDEASLSAQVTQLSTVTAQLPFTKAKIEKDSAESSSSWFDQLITVRKIDDNAPETMTQGDQFAIRSQISGHFGLLNKALIVRDQAAWVAQIERLSEMLPTHFGESSQAVTDDLQSLLGVTLKPELPKVSALIDQLDALASDDQSGE